MAFEQVKLRDIVDRAVVHNWSIPEFQRGFVWKATQVRDLAESLWFDYPIGSLLVWDSRGPAEEQHAHDAQRPSLWLVDGQQRSSALCVLFGRKPYWWPSADEWNDKLRRYDIRFDVNAKEPPYFWVANAAIRKVSQSKYIPLCDILVLDTAKEKDQRTLQELAKKVKLDGLCDGMDAMEVYTRLDRLRKIREKDIVVVTIDHELEDVVEIFSRLNSKGTRVTEADIYLGIVAAKNAGWVRDTFLPYLRILTEAGFGIDPNLLFRTLTGVGTKKVRFKEIPDGFWECDRIAPAWQKTSEAWKRLIARFREFGILSTDPMPTQAALVTMVSLIDKFDDNADFPQALYWFLQASRFGRYSGSGATSLEEDLRDVAEGASFTEAVQRLLKHFSHEQPLTSDDFMRDYADSRFGRFFLYLMVYRNKAQDWDQHGHRLGFEGINVLADFRPQWHHIFPRKYLDGKVDEVLINALANIAVIGPEINIRISAKDPMSYIDIYQISPAKLGQQFVDSQVKTVAITQYENWLRARAQRLAEEGNAFLRELRGSLVSAVLLSDEPEVVDEADDMGGEDASRPPPIEPPTTGPPVIPPPVEIVALPPDPKCQQFIQQLQSQQGETQARLGQAILNFLRSKKAAQFTWHHTEKRESVVARLVNRRQKQWLLGMTTTGRVWIPFGQMRKKSPFDDRSKREELARRLNAIGAKISDNRLERFPGFAMAVLQETDKLQRFLQVIEWTAQEIGEAMQTSGGDGGEPHSGRWDEASFFESLMREKGTRVACAARAIFDWAKSQASLRWNSGRTGVVSPMFGGDGRRYLLRLTTKGRVEIPFRRMRRQPPFSDDTKRHELLARLNQVPGLSIPERAVDRWTTIPLADIGRDPSKLIEVFDWAAMQIKGAP